MSSRVKTKDFVQVILWVRQENNASHFQSNIHEYENGLFSFYSLVIYA